jgi:hypothetical protein
VRATRDYRRWPHLLAWVLVLCTVGLAQHDPWEPGQTGLTDREVLNWNSSFHAIAFGRGRFVVPDYHRSGVFYSDDGRTWHQAPCDSQYLEDVTFGEAGFVALGSLPYVARSTDGVHWQTSPWSRPGDKIAFGHGLYVVVSGSQISHSQNGIDWSHPQEASFDLSGLNEDLIFTGENFVALGQGLAISTDGIHWSLSGSPMFSKAIAFGDGQFVCVGAFGEIHTSHDGKNWTEQESGTSKGLEAVTFAEHEFFAVGESGTMLRSKDGRNWETLPSATPFSLHDICYGNQKLLAVGDGPTIVDIDRLTGQTRSKSF